MSILKYFYKALHVLHFIFNHCIYTPVIKASLGACGRNVHIAKCSFSGIHNIFVGSDVSFGGGNTCFLTTRAKVYIGNHVMFGPSVTIITGNHRTDILGRYMNTITDDEKLPENDKDICIEDDVWIGANSTILMGVTIHTGSIVAAGSVVTKDIPPYTVVGGVPARVIKNRFSDSDLKRHLKILTGDLA